jgi:hypothetical protein
MLNDKLVLEPLHSTHSSLTDSHWQLLPPGHRPNGSDVGKEWDGRTVLQLWLRNSNILAGLSD